jgi:hypothetical protein
VSIHNLSRNAQAINQVGPDSSGCLKEFEQSSIGSSPGRPRRLEC